SLSTPIICSSVNRFFMTAPLRNGLYIVNVLITGSRSPVSDAEFRTTPSPKISPRVPLVVSALTKVSAETPDDEANLTIDAMRVLLCSKSVSG
ncbi:hypothetical protein, partial [Ralstonia chuxiongensis]|uniref:hypothetical protein n=1 Tax=Ralstonia chuxiongensis TaxID=2957504 RepID=UPI00292D09EA